MKFKLLYIAPDFYPSVSGYSNACTGFIEALEVSGGYSIDVLTFSSLRESKERDYLNVRIHRLNRKRILGSLSLGSDVHLFRKIESLDQVVRYDFILFETAEFPVAQLKALRRFSNRVIVRVHACAETEWALYRSELHYKWVRLFLRLFFKKVRNIISTTPYYQDFIGTHYLNNDPLAIAEKSFFVVPNTVPGESLGMPCRTKRGNNEKIRLLTLGRMDYYGELQKNFIRLLCSISLLQDRDYFDRLELTIVGDGDLHDSLFSLAKNLGIEKHVVFHRALSNQEIREIQADSDAVILASTFEGMSIFATEALASGSPLIISSNTGLKGLVDNKINGIWLENPFDVHEIAAKIDCFLTELLPNYELLSAASRRKYVESFSHRRVELLFNQALRFIKARNESVI